MTLDGRNLIDPVVAEDASHVTISVMGIARQSVPTTNIKSRESAKLLDNLSSGEAADLITQMESGREKAGPN